MQGSNAAPPRRALARTRAAEAMIEDLTAQIRSGRLAPGRMTLSGPALSRRYGIGYQTVVRALNELAERGWLVRQQGRGTFVAPHPPRETGPGAAARRPTVLLALDPQALIRGRFGFPVVKALDEALAREGFRVRYAPLSATGERALLEEWTPRVGSGAAYAPVDVAFLIAFDRPRFLARALQCRPGLPALAIHFAPGCIPGGARFDALLVDDRPGGSQAGAWLIGQGHRRLAYLGGPHGDPRARARGAGFREALRAHGLKMRAEVWAPGWDEAAGRAKAPELLARLFKRAAKRAPEASRLAAVFCANDRLASGLYDAAAQRGLRIPKDLSVIGFDDNEIAARLSPPLTTMRIDRAAYGRQAARMVKERLAFPARAAQVVRVPVARVERASVAGISKEEDGKKGAAKGKGRARSKR